MDKHELEQRTRRFAVRVFKLVEHFPKNEAARVVTNQLLRPASSVAANYRSVNRGKSKSDFSNKLKIVLEEVDESNFWLTFVAEVALLDSVDEELMSLTNESDELTAIFTSAVKSSAKSTKSTSQIVDFKSLT
jgi:four helix bundle protein